jgi:hypothetical protein
VGMNGRPGTWSRRWNVRLGRLQVRLQIYRHSTPHLPGRWVVQPIIIWDCKR